MIALLLLANPTGMRLPGKEGASRLWQAKPGLRYKSDQLGGPPVAFRGVLRVLCFADEQERPLSARGEQILET